MKAGILVTPPAGYEVSTDNSTFSSTVTAGAAGTVNATVYIRLTASAAIGTYLGNVVLSSTGANSVTVAVAPGTVNSDPGIYPNPVSGTITACAGDSFCQSLTFSNSRRLCIQPDCQHYGYSANRVPGITQCGIGIWQQHTPVRYVRGGRRADCLCQDGSQRCCRQHHRQRNINQHKCRHANCCSDGYCKCFAHYKRRYQSNRSKRFSIAGN